MTAGGTCQYAAFSTNQHPLAGGILIRYMVLLILQPDATCHLLTGFV